MANPPANTSDGRATRARQSAPGRSRTAREALDRPLSVDQLAELTHVYDFRRNCQLNELYYGHRLAAFSRIALALEIAIIVGSGASGVSGWFLLGVHPGLKAIWGAIAAASTLLAAIKPAIQIDKRIRRYSGLFTGYRELSLSMATILEDIIEFHGITSEMGREIARLRTRYKKLAEDDDPQPSMKLIAALQEEVNRRIPVNSLWYPDPGGTQENEVRDGKTHD